MRDKFAIRAGNGKENKPGGRLMRAKNGRIQRKKADSLQRIGLSGP